MKLTKEYFLKSRIPQSTPWDSGSVVTKQE